MPTLAAPPIHVSEPLITPLTRSVPAYRIEFANRYALRGSTPKGGYETRYNQGQDEVRTTYLPRGGNPLKHIQLLARTAARDFDPTRHVDAIRQNEEELPWVRREIDASNGRRTVTVLPFGAAENSPRVIASTSASTGFVSIHVEDAREMSPAEAKLVAKALSRAAKLAAE